MAITREQICDYLETEWGDYKFILADGLEDAFMGVVFGKMREPVVCYDRAKCIAIFMTRDGMSAEEAEENFGFNVIDAWVGEGTPVFLETLSFSTVN